MPRSKFELVMVLRERLLNKTSRETFLEATLALILEFLLGDWGFPPAI